MKLSRMKHLRKEFGGAEESPRDAQAARWRVRLSTPNVSTHNRSEFEKWCSESPDNRLA